MDTAEESLALSLSEQGHVDLEYMSKLTGKTAEGIINDLTGIIFRDPVKVDADGNPLTGSFSFKEDVPAYLDFLNKGLEAARK